MNQQTQRSVDLATELGESFALPPAGIAVEDMATVEFGGKRLHPRHLMARDDSDLLRIISTGYVACGAHSGDAIVIGRTLRDLVSRKITIGAHPSYPDIFGFGQESIALDPIQLQDVLLAQLATVATLAQHAGGRLATVKFHGALSFDASYDVAVARNVAEVIKAFDPGIALVCMAASPGVAPARACGIKVLEEAYIDRAYDATGRIVSRKLPGALITDPALAVAQMLSILEQGYVRAIDGSEVAMRAETFCLHSDTPNSAAISAAVVAALGQQGIAIAAPR